MARGPGTCSLILALGSRDMPFYAPLEPLPGTRKKITPRRQLASVPMRRWEASGKASLRSMLGGFAAAAAASSRTPLTSFAPAPPNVICVIASR